MDVKTNKQKEYNLAISPVRNQMEKKILLILLVRFFR